MTGERTLYALERGWTQLKAEPLASLAATILLALFLFLSAILAGGIGSTLHPAASWVSESKLLIFLRPGISLEERRSLGQELGQWPEVLTLRQLSRVEAGELLIVQPESWSKGLETLLNQLASPPLELSPRVETDPERDSEDLFEKIGRFPQVEKVFYGKSFFEKLQSASSWMRATLLSFAAVLAAAAVCTAMVVTRLDLSTHKEALDIYRIAGATPGFMKSPFYLESALRGGVSAALASGLLIGCMLALQGLLPALADTSLFLKGAERVVLISGLFGYGVLLSGLGCWLALRRL